MKIFAYKKLPIDVKYESSSNYPAAHDYANPLFQTFFLPPMNQPETSEKNASCCLWVRPCLEMVYGDRDLWIRGGEGGEEEAWVDEEEVVVRKR